MWSAIFFTILLHHLLNPKDSRNVEWKSNGLACFSKILHEFSQLAVCQCHWSIFKSKIVEIKIKVNYTNNKRVDLMNESLTIKKNFQNPRKYRRELSRERFCERLSRVRPTNERCTPSGKLFSDRFASRVVRLSKALPRVAVAHLITPSMRLDLIRAVWPRNPMISAWVLNHRRVLWKSNVKARRKKKQQLAFWNVFELKNFFEEIGVEWVTWVGNWKPHTHARNAQIGF